MGVDGLEGQTTTTAAAGRRRVAALVLAAGASTRMGRPKALLPWRGATFVAHAVALAEAVDCAPIVVVTGATRLPDRALSRPSPKSAARVVHHDDWRHGPLSSLQHGLRSLADAGRHAPTLVLTVDRPHVRADTVARLIAAHGRAPGGIWQPSHAGRRGHPILYPALMIPVLLALPARGDNSPRDLFALPEVGALRHSVPVDDPAVLENIDTPAAYQAMLAQT